MVQNQCSSAEFPVTITTTTNIKTGGDNISKTSREKHIVYSIGSFLLYTMIYIFIKGFW